jgi:hypothetical protein
MKSDPENEKSSSSVERMDVVFLDYDGALHPSPVWFDPALGRVDLRSPGHELFESVPVLEAAIAPYPSIRIVLSTSWVEAVGYEEARGFLPETLQRRVIGATYDPCSPDAWRYPRLTRYDAIALDVKARKPKRWLAIDDDSVGWAPRERDRLIWVPPQLGLACPDAQARLHAGLAACFPQD